MGDRGCIHEAEFRDRDGCPHRKELLRGDLVPRHPAGNVQPLHYVGFANDASEYTQGNVLNVHKLPT